MKKTFLLRTLADTQALAGVIGANLRGGECIEFISDLGGGKTTFISSLVVATDSQDNVASPSFTISRQYTSPKHTVYHFDFYRLNEPGHAAAELEEALADDQGIVLVEWANSVRGVLPDDRVVVRLDKLAEEAEGRVCVIETPEAYEYVLEGVV